MTESGSNIYIYLVILSELTFFHIFQCLLKKIKTKFNFKFQNVI